MNKEDLEILIDSYEYMIEICEGLKKDCSMYSLGFEDGSISVYKGVIKDFIGIGVKKDVEFLIDFYEHMIKRSEELQKNCSLYSLGFESGSISVYKGVIKNLKDYSTKKFKG